MNKFAGIIALLGMATLGGGLAYAAPIDEEILGGMYPPKEQRDLYLLLEGSAHMGRLIACGDTKVEKEGTVLNKVYDKFPREKRMATSHLFMIMVQQAKMEQENVLMPTTCKEARENATVFFKNNFPRY